jgi:hypothetical protein
MRAEHFFREYLWISKNNEISWSLSEDDFSKQLLAAFSPG